MFPRIMDLLRLFIYSLPHFYHTGQVIGIHCTLHQEVELEDTVKSEFGQFRPVVNQEMYL